MAKKKQLNWIEYESKQNQKIPYITLGIFTFMFGLFLALLYGGWYWLMGFAFMHIGIYGAWFKCSQIDKLYDNYLEVKQEAMQSEAQHSSQA